MSDAKSYYCNLNHAIEVEAINNIPTRTPGGALVPLSSVALVEQGGRHFIRREQLQRYAVIQMGVQGREVNGPSRLLDRVGRRVENQQRAMAKLAVIVPLTIRLIIVNVPFAAIGGILSLFVSGQYLSVPAAVGFIAVFGVTMLNGIVLVSLLNGLRQQGVSLRDAVVQGEIAPATGVDDDAGGDLGPAALPPVHRRGYRNHAAAGHGGGWFIHVNHVDTSAAAIAL